MNEARLRQRSLLPKDPGQQQPREVDNKVFELLVQLILSVVPAMANEGGEHDEQDR
jgi:hypothetical protein